MRHLGSWHQDGPNPVSHRACERRYERLPGSLRRECLDWLIILGERHLVQVLREYFDHYNRARAHPALGLRPPEPHRSQMAA